MRKLMMLFTGVCLATLIGLAGCACGEKDKKEHVITSEDYVWGKTTEYLQAPLLKTEKGHYYYSEVHGGWRYYDLETGKDMFLCNKPECKHDGSVFCVATNSKYRYERYTMYNGMIYATAIEETETQYLYKLVAIALDGAELTEIATYLTVERSGQVPDNNKVKKEVCIHRNKAIISMTAMGASGLYEDRFYGTAILDLDTKKVEYLDVTPLGKENPETTNITGYGDHIYYCRKEGKKTVLHRRNIKDNSDESYKLLTNFRGQYVVMNENEIVYLRGREYADSLCVHNHTTGENVEKDPFWRMHYSTLPNGEQIEQKELYTISDISTDGTYLYVVHNSIACSSHDEEGNERRTWLLAEVRVLDYDLNEVAFVNMADVELPEGTPKMAHGGWNGYIHERVCFLGEDIYVSLYEPDPERKQLNSWYYGPLEEAGIYTFQLKRSDLLQGKLKAEFVYKREAQE